MFQGMRNPCSTPLLKTGFHKYGALPSTSVATIGFVLAFGAPGFVTSRASAGRSDVDVACCSPLTCSSVVMTVQSGTDNYGRRICKR